MVVKIQVEVFWVVTSQIVTVGYQHFGVSSCLHQHSEVNGTQKEGTDIGREYKWG
jgi:hypothetical protein